MIAAAARKGRPRRDTRSPRKCRVPLRRRLFHTNKPEMKNISDMKSVSLNPTSAENPPHFCASTTGNACHHRGCAVRDSGTGGENGQYASMAWCASTSNVINARRYPIDRLYWLSGGPILTDV